MLCALLLGGCGGVQPLPPIAGGPEDAWLQLNSGDSREREPLSAPKAIGPAPTDFRTTDWTNLRLPAEFCHVEQPVEFHNGEAMVTSRQWGIVHMSARLEAQGDLLSDGNDYAAVSLGCDNNGGTAAGLLANGDVVLTVKQQALWSLGTVTPKKRLPDTGPSWTTKIEPSGKGALRVTESWFRRSDGTCCPSGVAETVWTSTDSGFVSAPTRVVK
ncbi:hypothetical protein [Nocardia africana]|uniref:hypothetical protein n=1 Tax=Nocardia africana TaxID=134964 RepID=UPI0007A3A06A|nr:hypothetical protein [Nocardia africana]